MNFLEKIIDLLSKISIGHYVLFLALLIFGIYNLHFTHALTKKDLEKIRSKRIYFYLIYFLFLLGYIFSLSLEVEFFVRFFRWMASILFLYFLVSILDEKVIHYYGEEVVAGGNKYYKTGYKVSVFSLIIRVSAFLIGIFLFIQILEINSYIQIGGIWAGILAFLGFTAPFWAPDIVAGMNMLHSQSIETGNVVYLYDYKIYAWVKSLTLSEVKLIDISTNNPIILRASKFRDLAVKNISQGIVGKNDHIIQAIELTFDYNIPQKKVEELCYKAFDTMIEQTKKANTHNFFPEKIYREIFLDSFENYAVKYVFLYTIDSAFFVIKAKRLLNNYLLQMQQKYDIYASTADLVNISQKENTKDHISVFEK